MTETEALKIAAAALWNAHNALNICTLALPREWAGPGSGKTDLRAEVIVSPVKEDIMETLRAIGDMIGRDAMLGA